MEKAGARLWITRIMIAPGLLAAATVFVTGTTSVAIVRFLLGLVIEGPTMGTWWALFGMTIAACGFYGSKGPFRAMPSMVLTGTAAAAAIAWINSIGNLGGFFGPWYVGFMKDATGSCMGGLYGLALFGLLAAGITAFFLDIPSRPVVCTQPAE